MYNITHGQNNSVHLSFILVDKAYLFPRISSPVLTLEKKLFQYISMKKKIIAETER